MLFLTCTVDTSPCPADSQVWASPVDVMDLTQLGITPETMLYVISWGFGVVIAGWLIGYVVGVGLEMIRKV